ncbi:MAG: glycosyltransferase family 2 protein [Patescibacteria group bacterium]
MPPNLSVIILTHNERHFLEKLLPTYERERLTDAELIVVDNGSSDNVTEWLRTAYPWILTVRNENNRGVAGGRNTGIAAARGEFLLFLDVDTELEPNAIQTLHAYMRKNDRVAIAGPQLVYPDFSPQYSCRTFPTPLTFVARAIGASDTNPIIRKHLMLDEIANAPRSVDWVLGACHIVRRQALKTIGLYDENFFLVYDDVDICYRVRRLGWDIMYVPQSVIRHHYQRRSAKAPLWSAHKWSHAKSAIRFFVKRYINK